MKKLVKNLQVLMLLTVFMLSGSVVSAQSSDNHWKRMHLKGKVKKLVERCYGPYGYYHELNFDRSGNLTKAVTGEEGMIYTDVYDNGKISLSYEEEDGYYGNNTSQMVCTYKHVKQDSRNTIVYRIDSKTGKKSKAKKLVYSSGGKLLKEIDYYDGESYVVYSSTSPELKKGDRVTKRDRKGNWIEVVNKKDGGYIVSRTITYY